MNICKKKSVDEILMSNQRLVNNFYYDKYTKNRQIKMSYNAFKNYDTIFNRIDVKDFYSCLDLETLSAYQSGLEMVVKEYEKRLFYAKSVDYGLGQKVAFMDYSKFNMILDLVQKRKEGIRKHQEYIIYFVERNFGEPWVRGANGKVLDYRKMTFEQKYRHCKNKLNAEENRDKLDYILEYKKLTMVEQDNLLQNVRRLNYEYQEAIIYNSPKRFALIQQQGKDTKRNIMLSKINAFHKAVYNFHTEKVVSFVTLTLAHHNSNGCLSKEVKDLKETKSYFRSFLRLVKKNYAKYLKTTRNYNKDQIKEEIKKIKYFVVCELQKAEVWHFHIMINVDLTVLGIDDKMMVQNKGLVKNSEFLEKETYYKKSSNKKKYTKNNGWEIVANVVVPKVFKMWADTVKKNNPKLKRLNPISQNLQVYHKLSNNKTSCKEVRKCKLIRKETTINMVTIISKYISKYLNKIGDDSLKLLIKQRHNFINGYRLFQFSINCKKPPVEKYLKYLPQDLAIDGYSITSFYAKNILDYNKEHPLRKMLVEQMLNAKLNSKENELVLKDSYTGYTQKVKKKYYGEKDLETDKKPFIEEYLKNNSYASMFYFSINYEKQARPLNKKIHDKLCKKLNKVFKLSKMKKKQVPRTYLEQEKMFLDFNNYVDPVDAYFDVLRDKPMSYYLDV
ncbi:rolling circle replication-associated protein [Candidatus Phytoplasma meliae]|uniref:Replication-associated protein ORF2/G2P domain-containing protein n=1 Tax=Candidatus Phytoplasma meliae TaxID=1848402 RepID=A0ABS5CXU4_9MOLU|nr:hypothetical protein [Candidatus Phytoplasma meliae]MBP5835790.1 hypothetical protein [Candidatus Phytoplasma meliae]MBP5836199.1 hypothetical protein [Candidatus Phytoplasma meliae]